MDERADVRVDPTAALAVLAGFGAAVAALLAFAGAAGWLFDLLTHFRPVYAVVMAVAIVVLAARRRFPWAAAGLLAASLVNAVPMITALPDASSGGGGPGLRVLLSNVLYLNPERGPLIDLIEGSDPDLVVLVEVDRDWIDDLRPTWTRLPHGLDLPRTDCSGLAVRSRWPLDDARVVELGGAGRGSVEVVLRVPGAPPVNVIATHPPPPVGAREARSRDDQLAALADHLADVEGPRMVVGDLNATPWSTALVRFRATTGLAVAGGPLGGTWPTPLPWLRLPIDHVLFDDSIRLRRHRVGPNIGSDHLPIVVDLELPPASIARDGACAELGGDASG